MGGYFFAENISLTVNGPGKWVWSCIGCTGWETINVLFKGRTFTGTALPGPVSPGEQAVPCDGVLTGAPRTLVSVAVALSSATTVVDKQIGAAVTVTAGNEDLIDVSLGHGLVSSNGSVAVISAVPAGLDNFDLAAGKSRTFEFGVKGTGVGVTTLNASVSGTADSGPVTASTSFTLPVLAGSPLVVIVKLTPKDVHLDVVPDSADSEDGEPLQAMVQLKNGGKSTLDNVHVIDKLVIGYNDGDPKLAVVPLRQHGGPTLSQGGQSQPAADLGSLQPGEISRPITFDLIANGDGGYSVEALATADKPGGGYLHASGEGSVTVTSPMLSFDAENPDELGGLWGAGVPYTVDVTVQDLSYRKSVVLLPHFQASGNAQLGPLVGADAAIPDAGSVSSCQPPQAIQLSPREKEEYKLVVYTSSAAVTEMGKTGGGTRSTVIDGLPIAFVVNDDGDGVGKQLETDDVDMDPDAGTRLDVSLQDRGLPTYSQEDYSAGWATFNIAKGALEGVGAFEWGLVTGLYSLVRLGISAIPTSVLYLWQFESEGWEYLKENPSLLLTLDGLVVAPLKAMAEHATALVETVGKAAGQVNTQLTNYLSRIYADWYGGNWAAAAEEMSSSTVEVGLNAASFIPSFIPAVAGCIMARSSKFLGALNDARAAAFATASEKVGSLAGLVSWTTAASKIADLALGMELSFKQLAQLYGLTEDQVNFLRNFAKENKVIITVRSRAAQSITWLKEGAVLKPEQIKIKSVSWLDTLVLGYRKSDLGRVILRTPITPQQLASNLAAQGINGSSSTYKAAFKLLAQRVFEYDHAPGGFVSGSGGYYKDLVEAAEQKKMILRWNLADNSVNPNVAENGYTKYDFRLYDEGDGNLVPQFFVEGKGPCIPPACLGGGWRSVTGDVDFLSMTDVDGRGLPAAIRVSLYEKLAGNNPINMLHPAADTWTSGPEFWFEAKQNEFNRAGPVPQFAPDGALPRVVEFNPKASYFDSADDYRVGFTEGYEGPMIDLRPEQGPALPPGQTGEPVEHQLVGVAREAARQ
jgi:hypothetical protein